MTASTGATGKGVLFQVDLVASPITWITIANVRSINPTGMAADEIDFTHLDSDGSFREFRQGFKDAGTINIEYHLDIDAVSHIGTNGLLGLFNSGVVFNWRINFAAIGAGWAWAFVGQGFIQNPGDVDINVDGPITGTATVRRTGPTTVAAVA
jgi:predicted secreted protein